MIQPISENPPSAREVAGSGPHGPLPHITVVIATNDQNARRADIVRGGLTERYTAIPASHIAPSTMSVSGIEYQSPRPMRGDGPGQSGMSGAWLAKSSSQWLMTRAMSKVAATGTRRQRATTTSATPHT